MQGRPALVFGDTVYVRAAAEPTREFAAAVVAVEASCALLAAPGPFWAKAWGGDKQARKPYQPNYAFSM